MKIGLIFNEKNKIMKSEISLIWNILISLNSEIFVSKFSEFSGLSGAYALDNPEDVIKSSEIILAFGGDGTIIKAAKAAAVYGKSVLGINVGHLGFLSALEKSDLNGLEGVLKGNFEVSERMMLECDINGEKFLALNDIVLSRSAFSQVANYSVSREDNEKICDFIADGLILATATGSTAYSLSAGGPILEPELENIVITPICPHIIGSRSRVLGGEKPLILNFNPKNDSECCLFVDGEACFSSFKAGKVAVRRSKLKAGIINPIGFDFYSRINEKLAYKNIGR